MVEVAAGLRFDSEGVLLGGWTKAFSGLVIVFPVSLSEKENQNGKTE